MAEKHSWIADDLPQADFGEEPMQRGESWDAGAGSNLYSAVKRPIGFMRHKLIVRVKAGSQPIDPGRNTL